MTSVRILLVVLVAVIGACGAEGESSAGAQASAEDPFQCIGVPSDQCRSLVDDTRSQVRASVPVQAEIRCTKPICTDAEGEASVRVLFLNGQIVDWVTSWTPAAPMPRANPPVPATSAPSAAPP